MERGIISEKKKKTKKQKTKGKKVTFWLLTYHSSKNFREVKCSLRNGDLLYGDTLLSGKVCK